MNVSKRMKNKINCGAVITEMSRREQAGRKEGNKEIEQTTREINRMKTREMDESNFEKISRYNTTRRKRKRLINVKGK